MGKGSGRRPEDNQAFLSEYDRIFGPKCSCMTRTPEIRFHDKECKYRQYMEELDNDSNRQDLESGQRQHAVDSPTESQRGESEDEGAYADD